MDFKYVFAAILLCFLINGTCAQETNKSKPKDGVYFVSRNSIIDSTNYILSPSIRPYDKMDINDTTILIKSNGEGWLDKDSLPVGKWLFFAADQENSPYLLKTGEYKKTELSMFSFTEEEKLNIKRYGTSPESLQMEFYRQYPFIKTGTWYYYHPNGKIWKKVTFNSQYLFFDIVFIKEMNSFGNEFISQILVSDKEKHDEWPKDKIEEYNDRGHLFKRLTFLPNGRLILKEIFDNKGNLLHKYSSLHGGINPTNF